MATACTVPHLHLSSSVGVASKETGTPASPPASIAWPTVSGQPEGTGRRARHLSNAQLQQLEACCQQHPSRTPAHPPSGDSMRSVAPQELNSTALKAATVASGAANPRYMPSGPWVPTILRAAPMAVVSALPTCILTLIVSKGWPAGILKR